MKHYHFKFGFLRRALSMLLLLILVLGSFPISALAAEPSPNWAQQEPTGGMEHWPLSTSNVIVNVGGAGTNALRHSTLTYRGYHVNSAGNVVIDLVWSYYQSSSTYIWDYGTLFIDPDLLGKVQSVKAESLKAIGGGTETTIQPSTRPDNTLNNLYDIRRLDFVDAGGGSRGYNIPVRLELKPGVSPEGAGNLALNQDYVIQFRTYDNVFQSLWCKEDTLKPVTYSSYTMMSTIPFRTRMATRDTGAGDGYTHETTPSTTGLFRAQEDKVYIYYKYPNKSYSMNAGLTEFREFALSHTIEPAMWEMISDQPGAIQVVSIDHNTDPASTVPILLNKSDFKPDSQRGGYTLRLSKPSFNSAGGIEVTRKATENIDGQYYHDSLSINPSGIQIVYTMDIDKMVNSFDPDVYQQMFTVASHYEGGRIKRDYYPGTVPQALQFTKDQQIVVNFPILGSVNGLDGKDAYLRIGDTLMKGEETSLGRIFTFTSPYDFKVSAGTPILVSSPNNSTNTFAEVQLSSGKLRLNKNSSGYNPILDYTPSTGSFFIQKTFYLPKINEIFTEDTTFKGEVRYPKASVYGKSAVAASYSKALSADTATPATDPAAYAFTMVKGDGELLKDMPVRFRVADKENGKLPSDVVTEKVKARVTFNENYTGAPAAKVVVAPSNDLYRGEPGYQANGLDYNGTNAMPDYDETTLESKDNPKRIGYFFDSWNTKADGSGTAFTKDTAIDKSMTVYAIWREALPYSISLFKDEETTSFASISDEIGKGLQMTLEQTKNRIEQETTITIPEGYILDEGKTNTANSFPVTFTQVNQGLKVYYKKDPAAWSTITFEKADPADTNGTLTATTPQQVLKTSTWADIVKPTVTPEAGYKAVWAPELPTVDSTPMSNSVDYKVSFVVDDTQVVNYTVEYYKDNIKVDSLTETKTAPVATPTVALADIQKAVEGASYKSVDPAAGSLGTIQVHEGTVVKLYYISDILPGTDLKPDTHVTVTFNASTQGAFVSGAVTSYHVNKSKGITLGQLTKPAIDPNPGWNHTGWNTADDHVILVDTTVTATYTQILPSAKPIDLQQALVVEGETEKQVISGKLDPFEVAMAQPGNTITLVDATTGEPLLHNGEPIVGTIKSDGTFEIPIAAVDHGAEVKVQMQEPGKLPTLSDAAVTIDKQGPAITDQKASAYGDFLDITATTEPNSTVKVMVGAVEYPAQIDDQGKITARIPGDAVGEITIVAKDPLGNSATGTVAKPAAVTPVNIQVRQPYVGQKALIVVAPANVPATVIILRGDDVIYTAEKAADVGRISFTGLPALVAGDVIQVIGNKGMADESLPVRITVIAR